MIDIVDFRGMVKRLAKVTGSCDEETFRIIYEAIKDYKREAVAKGMETLAKEHSFYRFPTLAEVIESVKDYTVSPKHVPVWCDECNSTGIVLVEKNGRASAYRCSCQNGRRISKKIRQFSEVSGLYVSDDCPPEALMVVNVEELSGLDRSVVFDKGVSVQRVCETCWEGYRVDHRRKVTAGQLADQHSTRPGQCLKCYVEEGKRKGLWT